MFLWCDGSLAVGEDFIVEWVYSIVCSRKAGSVVGDFVNGKVCFRKRAFCCGNDSGS